MNININIPVDQLKQRVCSCGGTVFVQALLLKELPPICSPTGRMDTLPIATGFICSNCGEAMSQRPEEQEQESRIITLV